MDTFLGELINWACIVLPLPLLILWLFFNHYTKSLKKDIKDEIAKAKKEILEEMDSKRTKSGT